MPYTITALNAIQNLLNRDTTLTLPANWYFSLHLMNALTTGATITATTITVDYPVTLGAGLVIAPETGSAETFTVAGVTGAGPYVVTLSAPVAITHALGVEVLCDPGPNGENTREPSGGGFARAQRVRNTTDFAVSSGGDSVTAVATLYATITSTLGTATHWLKWSALTSGTLWEWGRLTHKTVIDASSNPLQFPAGTLISRLVPR